MRKKDESIVVIIMVVVVMSIMFFPMISKVKYTSGISGDCVRIYQNAKCTLKTNEINWGDLYPNDTGEVRVFVKNVGNYTVEINVYGENWNPENAYEYLIFYSEHDNYLLKPDEVIRLNLFLFVKPDIKGIREFDFDIVIDELTFS